MTIAPDVKEPDLPPIPDGAVMVTLKIARFNPEDPDSAGFQSFRVPCLPSDRLLNLLIYVKSYLDGTLTFRRSQRARRVRVGCDAYQRRQPAGVQGPDARPVAEGRQAADRHHRADPRVARGEGPGGEHGAVLRRLPGGEAVPDHQRQCAHPGNAFRAPPTAPATTTPPNASCARAAPPAARCSGTRAATSARPRSSTPTGSSSTAATRAPPSGLDILNEVDGVWRCRTTFNCTEACPRGIEVTKAIQEVKRVDVRTLTDGAGGARAVRGPVDYGAPGVRREFGDDARADAGRSGRAVDCGGRRWSAGSRSRGERGAAQSHGRRLRPHTVRHDTCAHQGRLHCRPTGPDSQAQRLESHLRRRRRQCAGSAGCRIQGRVDLAATNISITADREKYLDFSQPILTAGLQIVVPAGTTERTQPGLVDFLRLLFSKTMLFWLLAAVILTIVPAHLIWLLERRDSQAVVSKKYFPGIFQSFEWGLGMLSNAPSTSRTDG